MSIRIYSNPVASWAGRQLRESQQALHESIERLGSGKRITKAADDASGMIIADSLGGQARGMGQAIRNANDAVSMAQIADGALQESASIIHDIRTKAVQAAQGGQTLASRQAIQGDIDRLLGQLNMIADTTSFNNQKLLSGEFTNKVFQVGANPGQTTTLSIKSAEAVSLGDSEHGRLSDIDVLTQDGAEAALDIADAALGSINRSRADIGSMQNQLTSTIHNLRASQINALNAESTIRDIDLAEESMILSKMKRLTRANIFALGQAKSRGEDVLDLLNT